MARERFCDHCRKWHRLDEPWPVACMDFRDPPFLPAPYIISDGMAPVKSMLDGKTYDSKSALRRTYRDAGVKEVGNDVATERKPPPSPVDRRQVRASVGKALAKAGLSPDEKLETE